MPLAYRWRMKKRVLACAEEGLDSLLDLDVLRLRYSEQMPMLPTGGEPFPKIRELRNLPPRQREIRLQEMEEQYRRDFPGIDGGQARVFDAYQCRHYKQSIRKAA